MSQWPTEREIFAISAQASSRSELHRYLLERILPAAGCDAGFIQTIDEPLAEETAIGFPVAAANAVHRDHDRLIPLSIYAPMYKAMRQSGAAIDLDILGEQRRSRLPLCDEYLAPMGIRSALCSALIHPGSKKPKTAVTLLRGGSGRIPPPSAAALARLIPMMSMVDAAWRAAAIPSESPLVATLTDRQRVLCLHLAAGMTNPEIARACGISLHTVRNHLVALFRKFDVLTRTELAMKLGASNGHSDATAPRGLGLPPSWHIAFSE
jgi:DNA-binding CsgD family transcriptional regulator